MKLSLYLSERIHLLLVESTSIKETGSFLELIVIRDLKNKLSIKQEDIDAFKITESLDEDGKNTGIKWELNGEVEFDFTEKEFDFLWGHINTLSMNKVLNDKLFRLASAINDIKPLSGV
jgi:hypothetical protein